MAVAGIVSIHLKKVPLLMSRDIFLLLFSSCNPRRLTHGDLNHVRQIRKIDFQVNGFKGDGFNHKGVN